MNEYDSERVASLLASRGFVPASSEMDADVVFVNTCTVRAKPQHKAYSFVGRLKWLKRAKPHARVVVGGCLAQQEGKKLLERFDHVDLVLGTHGIPRLAGLLDEVALGQRLAFTEFTYEFGEHLPGPQGAANPVSRFLTIMQGCDNFCSYCVVPHVRGREISRPSGDVLAEARGLVAGGARELILLGQNVNSYGLKNGDITFPVLLGMISGIEGLLRIRFTTSHPKDLSGELMETMAESDKIARQIHLPVQSGSDNVLGMMNRGYTRDDYLRKIEMLRQKMPDIAITTDLIVGFPGETEEDFADTLSLVEEVNFLSGFSFKYSDRPFTAAARLKDKVPEKVKSRRLAELQELLKTRNTAHQVRLVGEAVEVLVTGESRLGKGQMSGRCEDFRVVNFPGEDHLAGQLVEVMVEEALPNCLRGRMIFRADSLEISS